MSKKLLVLLAAALLLAALLACGTARMSCYSGYPGCDGTAAAIMTLNAPTATPTR